MNEGNIIVAIFQQSDGKTKRRPALILRELPPFRDVLLCGISTKLKQEVKGFDEIIFSTDDDFEESGLDSDSLIRLGFLLQIPRRDIVGTIGSISKERYHRLLKNLSEYLLKSATN
jgi:mRNA interferase MazF